MKSVNTTSMSVRSMTEIASLPDFATWRRISGEETPPPAGDREVLVVGDQ
jgi:hypothetical protein